MSVMVIAWRGRKPGNAAIDAAHENPRVLAMWEKYGELSDFVTIGDLAEAKQMFSPFAPVDLAS